MKQQINGFMKISVVLTEGEPGVPSERRQFYDLSD